MFPNKRNAARKAKLRRSAWSWSCFGVSWSFWRLAIAGILYLQLQWGCMHDAYSSIGLISNMFTTPLELYAVCLHHHWSCQHAAFNPIGAIGNRLVIPFESYAFCLQTHWGCKHGTYNSNGVVSLLLQPRWSWKHYAFAPQRSYNH